MVEVETNNLAIMSKVQMYDDGPIVLQQSGLIMGQGQPVTYHSANMFLMLYRSYSVYILLNRV